MHRIDTCAKVLLVAFSTSFCVAADHCSLKVVVRASNGLEPETVVAVRTSSGRIIEKENESGGVQFCGLGVKPVTVMVGGACNHVTIDNLELVWGEMRTVNVVYDPCQNRDGPPSTACEVLLFLHDESGGFIDGAEAQLSSPLAATYRTDSYGRLLMSFRFGTTIKGTLTKPGLGGSAFEYDCSVRNPTIEADVILRNLKRQRGSAGFRNAPIWVDGGCAGDFGQRGAPVAGDAGRE